MEELKRELAELVESFKNLYEQGALDTSSEETARSWIEKLLEIFGWNPRNPLELDQEFTLGIKERVKLYELDTNHKRPDYVFKRGTQNLTFVDAKRIEVDLEKSRSSAFQIKAYGWSSDVPCSFVSNFKEMAIYDCRPKPDSTDAADVARIEYITFDQYVEKFDLLYEHLGKEKILQGNLEEMYTPGESLAGTKTLNEDFSDLLAQFRCKLANHIFNKNRSVIDENNLSFLSSVIQVVLNRIIFIRICEGKGIENEGQLKELVEEGIFWAKFKELSNTTFYQHYDGPLFEINQTINELTIEEQVFESFIKKLYSPHPYKFDIIPISLLGNIYDNFLSRTLVMNDGEITDEYKKEYQQIQGAVSTPYYIVNKICNETIGPVIKELNLEQLFKIKILDPATGSGIFLVEIYNVLENYLKKYYLDNKDKDGSLKELFIERNESVFLKTELKRKIIESCIYGVDIDPIAVEVSRMSLAFKIFEEENIDGLLMTDIGLFGQFILNGIGDNIREGNSLVDDKIYELIPDLIDKVDRIEKVVPFNWEEEFEDIFEEKSGFDVVVGNPPYIEVKHYKATIPEMHHFVKNTYKTSSNHKIDIAIPFIERSLALLNDNGRLGYIVQKRFFKTEYGKKIRELLDNEKVLDIIIDFGDFSVFPKRMTYTSILILDKRKTETFNYYRLDNLHDIVGKVNSIGREDFIDYEDKILHANLKTGYLGSGPWSFDRPELIQLKSDLMDQHGTIGDHRIFKLHVGIQTLWDRAYHIRPIEVQGDLIMGKSGLSDEVIPIEKSACRKLVCNESFYGFRDLFPDVYAIFPYDIVDNQNQPILFPEFEERFPRAAEYLSAKKSIIKENVETNEDDDKWHLYTRVQNHVSQTKRKIIIPMTVKDSFASVDINGEFYLDNANLTALHLDNYDDELLYAVAAIINSTVFSILARITANPQSNDYVKLNKQFLLPIPFPLKNLIDLNAKKELHDLSLKIIQRQGELKNCKKDTTIKLLKRTLNKYWNEIDVLVEDIYGLSDEQKQVVRNNPRRLPRML